MMMEDLSGHLLIIPNYNDIPRAQKSSAPHVARQKGFQGRCGARATPGPGKVIVFCDGNWPKKSPWTWRKTKKNDGENYISYPLVMTNIANWNELENHHAINGKIHY